MGDLSNIIATHNYTGKRILVADADFSSIRYAVSILSKTGAEIISTSNGDDVVKLVYNENIDMVFMEMWLPVKMGEDAVREIRKFNNNIANIPIVACATEPGFESKERSLKAGCNDYLLKPVHLQQFLDMLKKYLK